MDSNESDRAEAGADTGGNIDSDAKITVDVVDNITWKAPVNNMKRLDFTGNSGLNITLQSPVYGYRKQEQSTPVPRIHRTAQHGSNKIATTERPAFAVNGR